MSFFNHVQLHEYDITDKGISQACYDELVASGNNSTEDQLRVLADDMREQFKDYMRPLFSWPNLNQFKNCPPSTPQGAFFMYIKRVDQGSIILNTAYMASLRS